MRGPNALLGTQGSQQIPRAYPDPRARILNMILALRLGQKRGRTEQSLYNRTMFSWLESFSINVLKAGRIPHHIAFIMDGNRRFAKLQKMPPIGGHVQGFGALKETLRICLELGVKIVTVYAFSLENFKRPSDEVDPLLSLCKDKLFELESSGFLFENLISVRILGETSLLPKDLQDTIREVTSYSSSFQGAILNVHLAYTSREEIVHALQNLSSSVSEGKISPHSGIRGEDIERRLYSSNEPDILVRTSGETRLSDYLLWQSSESQLAFLRVLWPDFSFWHISWLILMYQYQNRGGHRIKSGTA
ncbi:dehydrodolichyl diphosphate synthase-like [Planoprotostelium fungivorum]|uniref:Alkyl transferase n=1 Tax=Planoprotostelium fungivorum TaxID=1890364 RepID=A0A2P6MXI9_9EUKA|nr:dehydrodolichyl diphosphate synthase-like [Planoprotostelium fungivorum]